jgi:chaperonin GroEL
LYDRVDDAVCAVRSALEEGILPGGGKALFEMNTYEYIPSDASKEQILAADILQKAFNEPMQQIFQNAGMSMELIDNLEDDDGLQAGYGYNVKTGEYGDLIKMGVIDPHKVTRCALQNAVSVATTILSTNAIITMARSYGAA